MSAVEQYWTEGNVDLQFQVYFSQFLESLPLGLIWLDQKGCIKKQNQLSRVLLGYDGDDAIGKPWREVIAHCLSPHSHHGYEVLLRNGRRLDVTTQASPSLEDPAQLEQVILLNDVTQTRRLQQHVEQEDRLRELGLISATLSHQLKTPLATSLLYAEQLRHYPLSREKHTHACDQVISQLKYMTRQVNDLLFFVKGDLPVDRSQTLADVLKSVLQINRICLHHFKCTIEIDPALSLESIECHYDAVVGALSNLVSNACEAALPHTHIRLSVRKIVCEDRLDHGFYYFDVIDEGPGFDEVARRLLGSKAYSSKSAGNGIGLRFVRTVAEKHGGQLRFVKTHCGACVGLTIPIACRNELISKI